MADLCLRPAGAHGQWVHGLSWFAVVGSHAQALARLRARQMRASHYVLGGERAMTAGCARLAGRGPRYSAAQQVASHCAPECHAAIVPLGQAYWLVAVQDGAVLVGGDQMFADADQAQAALQALGVPAAGAPEVVMQALQSTPLPGSRLRVLPPRLGVWMAALLAPLACLLLWRALAAAPSLPGAVPAQPTQAYVAPPPLCLGHVLEGLHRLPMVVAGWRLSAAQCLPQQQWHCQARYQPASAQALSADFERRVGRAWRVDFPGLDEAVLHWTTDGVCRADAQPLDRRWMQALQPWRKAFTDIRLGPWTSTPQGDTRSLSVSGPLRSFSLLRWEVLPAHWSGLRLQVDPKQSSDARHSPLVLHLDGGIHADQTQP
ncbi:type 4b pilus protein PilO2 [Bordetella genomosp. 12]|uniref:Pilus assembly protein n=1 Tax=Bordetella genomosp. 12 TaxID=463035 RepID=A0A261VIL7_9BORD|nr:type 4b pilus protein PilO2 [Bordetella genomosp. 12]OZI73996.1 pilus assembly protein [Bordetella genomosp. 12]